MLIPFLKIIDENRWAPHEEHFSKGSLLFHKTPGLISYRPKENSLSPILKNREQKLALSCGIHGNETAPIEILWDILKQIKNEKLFPCQDVLFIFGHIPAMLAYKRFIDFNLNRLFSENYKNFPNAMESKRAREIENEMYQFFPKEQERNDQRKGRRYWHLDLHTAIRGSHHERFAVRPFYEDNLPLSEEELSLCSSLGIEAILQTPVPSSTFAGLSASKLNGISYTLELGKARPFGENDHSRFQRAKETLLKILRLGIESALSERRPRPLYYKVIKELIRDHKSYEFFISHEYLNFTPLKEGELIEKNRKGFLRAKEGESIVFPNPNVPQGQRTGLLVSPSLIPHF